MGQPPLDLRNLPTLLWGKVRRAFLIAFRKKEVERRLSQRHGDCTRCGACCKLLFRCPAYDETDGNPKCLIYNDRPGVCGLFPLDPKDLRDRDLTMPGTKCGYWFDGEGKPPVNVRWGPPKGSDGSTKIGTIAIIKAFFRKPGP